MEPTVVVPPAVGTLISALVELLKGLGLIKDGNGGRWALLFSAVASLVLTFLAEFGLVDLEGLQAQAVFEMLGLLGQMILVFVGAFLTHKVFRAANVFKKR